MLFEHRDIKKTNGAFVFKGLQTAKAHCCLNKPVLKSLWEGYSFHSSQLKINTINEFSFILGSSKPSPLKGNAYEIQISTSGIAVTADSERNLIYGYMTLLDMIKISDDGSSLFIECGELGESPKIENRMIHFCIFKETELWELERFVRLCGALKYSHIILEFWGTLKYDCLPELSWPNKFTKEDISPIIKDAHDMGIEIIPMFNHWGHASGARVKHGKHVVLDQNPCLAYLFDETGWRWDFEKPKVRKLLNDIRHELCTLCGSGNYFHIGCDEAYNFDYSDDAIRELCSFINEVANELANEGRRAIMWGDMLLCKKEEYIDKYEVSCPDENKEKLFLSLIEPNVIIADWQYWATKFPLQTSLTLKNNNRDVLVAPWDISADCSDTCTETVKKYGLLGIMHTTWHTLSKGMPYVCEIARSSWSDCKADKSIRTLSAAVLRKVYFADGNYERAGFSRKDIDDVI